MATGSQLHVDGKTLNVTNLNKVLYPDAGFTKGDLINYYIRISPFLLPHLKDRPITLKRYPDGVEGLYFYEKKCPSHRPKWVQTTKVAKSEGGAINYCMINDLPTLVWAANLADLELHTFLHKATAIERPTTLAFDLDPGPPADIVTCCEVGLRLKATIRCSRHAEFRQDIWLKRGSGLRSSEHPGHLRENQTVCSCCRAAPGTGIP